MKFYIDTSVFGGYWDKEFREDTRAFFEYLEKASVTLIYSDVTERELKGAPQDVQDVLKDIDTKKDIEIERIRLNENAEILAEKYMKEGVLTKKCEVDAQHIALASVYGVSALISWNFRHMVNFMRIQQYNSINLSLGYRIIDIRSPREILP